MSCQLFFQAEGMYYLKRQDIMPKGEVQGFTKNLKL
jgi:hypothetical protein